MADWTSIPDVTFEPDRPVLGSTHLAIVKNFEALAEGASGAPRVAAAALLTGNNERDWVLGRTAGATAGVVGTYIVAWNTTTTDIAVGGTIAGSNLRYQSANETNNIGGTPGAPFRQKTSAINNTSFPTANTTTLAGTWRAFTHGGGRLTRSIGDGNVVYEWMPAFWLRIS